MKFMGNTHGRVMLLVIGCVGLDVGIAEDSGGTCMRGWSRLRDIFILFVRATAKSAGTEGSAAHRSNLGHTWAECRGRAGEEGVLEERRISSWGGYRAAGRGLYAGRGVCACGGGGLLMVKTAETTWEPTGPCPGEDRPMESAWGRWTDAVRIVFPMPLNSVGGLFCEYRDAPCLKNDETSTLHSCIYILRGALPHPLVAFLMWPQ
jgi:hypothetical protein